MRYVGELVDLPALEQDEQAQDAIARTLIVIGEAAVRIQKAAPEFMAAHPELPWAQMPGICNKVVHDYFDVAWDVVWDTVKQDLPPLSAPRVCAPRPRAWGCPPGAPPAACTALPAAPASRSASAPSASL